MYELNPLLWLKLEDILKVHRTTPPPLFPSTFSFALRAHFSLIVLSKPWNVLCVCIPSPLSCVLCILSVFISPGVSWPSVSRLRSSLCPVYVLLLFCSSCLCVCEGFFYYEFVLHAEGLMLFGFFSPHYWLWCSVPFTILLPVCFGLCTCCATFSKSLHSQECFW